jgi:hypothetical protein
MLVFGSLKWRIALGVPVGTPPGAGRSRAAPAGWSRF